MHGKIVHKISFSITRNVKKKRLKNHLTILFADNIKTNAYTPYYDVTKSLL